MRTGLPAALLRGTPSAIRDDRFTRCPFPSPPTPAHVALARSSNTAMEHRNRCTDLRHPELLATSLLKCPRQDCCETPSETKKIGKLSPLTSGLPRSADIRRERRQRSSGRSIIWRRQSSGIRFQTRSGRERRSPSASGPPSRYRSYQQRGAGDAELAKVRLAGRC